MAVRRNNGSFISKNVRERNKRTRSWWQPSRSIKKLRRPRAAVLSAAIQDELIEHSEPEAVLVIGYKQSGDAYLIMRGVVEALAAEEWIIEEGEEFAFAAGQQCRLLDAGGLADVLEDLEEDYEINGQSYNLIEIERPLLASLAAA